MNKEELIKAIEESDIGITKKAELIRILKKGGVEVTFEKMTIWSDTGKVGVAEIRIEEAEKGNK